ncbi:MAG: hypothetical protein QM667_06590 [Asticcacaulis sp.]
MKLMALVVGVLSGATQVEPDFIKADNLILIEKPAVPYLLEGQSMHMDIEATGKVFTAICVIGHSGYLEDCKTSDDDYPDRAYVENVCKYMQTWRYALRAKSGENVVGKKVRFRWSYTLE